MFPRVRKGLAGACVDDGLLGQQGEADRGKEGLGSGTVRSCTNSRTAKPVLRQVLLTGGKEEGMRDGEGGEELKNA